MVKRKLLLIGLDGADWKLLTPLLRAGKLSNLQKLIKTGTAAPLISTIPPWTIPAWETISTGLTPKQLKLPGFLLRKGYAFGPYSLEFRPPKRFFDRLSETGLSVKVANLPNLFSAYKIKGQMIAGMFYTGGNPLAYPKGLVEKLEQKVGQKYLIDIVGERGDRTGRIKPAPEDDRQFARQLINLTRTRTTFFLELLKGQWDFAFLVYVGLDRIQHRPWNKANINRVHVAVDQAVGRLMAAAGEDTSFMVVSDHGFGAVTAHFNLNEWLLQQGYLVLKAAGSQPKINKPLWQIKEVFKHTARPAYDAGKRALQHLPPAEKILKQKLAKKKILEVEIDWQKTRAWAVGPYGAIYLNIRGREPQGVIPRSQSRRFLKKLTRELKQVNKKMVIEKGFDQQNGGPDLFIVPSDDGVQSLSTDIGAREIITRQRSGQHRREGIFIASGPGLRNLTKKKEYQINQIAGIVLRFFGIIR